MGIEASDEAAYDHFVGTQAESERRLRGSVATRQVRIMIDERDFTAARNERE